MSKVTIRPYTYGYILFTVNGEPKDHVNGDIGCRSEVEAISKLKKLLPQNPLAVLAELEKEQA